MPSKRRRKVTPGTLARPGWALIIWCDPFPCTGGVCQVVLNLANALNVHGMYRPVVIVNEWAAVHPRMEMRGGVQYVFVRMRDPPENSVRLFRRIVSSILAWNERRRLLRMIRTLNIQVVNPHYPTLAQEMFVARPCIVAGRPVKVIFSLHGMDIVGAAEWPEREYLTQYVFMLARGSAVVAVSHAFADLVKCVAPELAGKVSVIHNGVSAEAIHNYEPMNIALPAHYVLNVATFEACLSG